MPYRRHELSQKTGHTSANLFTVPETQDTVAFGGSQWWDIVPPQETAANTQPNQFMTWQVAPSMEMTDLNQSFLQIQGYFDFNPTAAQLASGATKSPQPICGDPLEIPNAVRLIARAGNDNKITPPSYPTAVHTAGSEAFTQPDAIEVPSETVPREGGGNYPWYLVGFDVTQGNGAVSATQGGVASDVGDFKSTGVNQGFQFILGDSAPSVGQVLQLTKADAQPGPTTLNGAIVPGGNGQKFVQPVTAADKRALGQTLYLSSQLPVNQTSETANIIKGYPANTYAFSGIDTGISNNTQVTFVQFFWVCGFDTDPVFGSENSTGAAGRNAAGNPNLLMGSSECRLAMYQNADMTVTPLLPAFLFNDVTLEINGTQVVASIGTDQPYAMVANILKNEPLSERHAGSQDRAYYLGESAKGYVGVAEGDKGRRDMFIQNETNFSEDANRTLRAVTMTYRLADCGFRTHGGWIPPASQIRLRAKLAEPTNLTYISNYKPGVMDKLQRPQWNFQKAELMVARKVLTPHAQAAFADTWNITPCKLWFEQIRVFRQSYAAGQKNVNIINALAGPSPKAVWVFVIPESDINSTNIGSRKMNLRPGAAQSGTDPSVYWQNVRLSIGGSRTYPIQSWTGYAQNQSGSGDAFGNPAIQGRDFNVSQLYQMYQTTCNDKPFLSSADFSMLMQPICFQLEERTYDGAWSPGEDTSIQFSGQFSGAFADRYNVMLVSFTDSIVEINKDLETIVQ